MNLENINISSARATVLYNIDRANYFCNGQDTVMDRTLYIYNMHRENVY
jgi:hypothetical protein